MAKSVNPIVTPKQVFPINDSMQKQFFKTIGRRHDACYSNRRYHVTGKCNDDVECEFCETLPGQE